MPSSSVNKPLALITGATSGIGRSTSFALANKGFNLLLLGRSHSRLETLRHQLERRHPAGSFRINVCDLANLATVREAAANIRQQHGWIDVLINNAGARFDAYQESPDGFELSFATNYLGHFLLTGLILDRLVGAPSARIVSVSSRRHRCVESFDCWLLSREKYDRWGAYDRSKLALTILGFELARRLSGTSVSSLLADPGIVASGFARNNGLVPWAKHIISSIIHRQLVSSAHAAETLVYLVTEPGLAKEDGGYYLEKKALSVAPAAVDTDLAQRLWTSSLDWVGLNEENCEAWRLMGPR